MMSAREPGEGHGDVRYKQMKAQWYNLGGARRVGERPFQPERGGTTSLAHISRTRTDARGRSVIVERTRGRLRCPSLSMWSHSSSVSLVT